MCVSKVKSDIILDPKPTFFQHPTLLICNPLVISILFAWFLFFLVVEIKNCAIVCQKGLCIIHLPEDPLAGAAEAAAGGGWAAAGGADFLLNMLVIDLLMLRRLLSLRLNGS